MGGELICLVYEMFTPGYLKYPGRDSIDENITGETGLAGDDNFENLAHSLNGISQKETTE